MKQFHILIKRFHLLRDLVLCAAATVVACGVAAAWHTNIHADDRRAVYNVLKSHDLASVVVRQDCDKGVIQLSGIVDSADSKDRAQQLAEQAAPGYSIDNQIQVNRAGLL
jgi:acetylglutamate synthase